MKTRILSLLLVLALLLSALPAGMSEAAETRAALLRSGESGQAKLTPPEIRALLQKYPNTTPDAVFDTAPSCQAPYSTGKVKTAVLKRVVNRLGALRNLAGLPAAAWDSALCEEAQYGAVLLAASNFSHSPDKPADMDDSFYQKGIAATGSSNIYAGLSLCATPDGFMEDSDSSNISRVGHRRWQLSPRMGKVGFGYAVNQNAAYVRYTDEKVFDMSRTPGDYDMIAWPASGWFPADLINGGTAWSVSINPRKYQLKSANAITVTLKRESDGKSWTLSQSACSGNGFSAPQFHVNTSGQGEGDCVIFRPERDTTYHGRYTVRITGITDLNGKAVDFAYQVRFFDLAPETFSDVPSNAWYAEAVSWAVDCEVTSGTGNGAFSPKKTCTREQVVTFLWNAAGKPEPTGSNNPFSDVKSGKYYCKAVLWAVEQGITKGVSDTVFGVGRPCTRAQVVTFLWRFAGEPEPSGTSNPFADLKEGASYYKAALWAVEKGITKGTSDTAFSPDKTCDRATIVTFLYRFLGWN